MTSLLIPSCLYSYVKIQDLITINVPVVFMARYVMVLRSATALRGALEGWALKIETFMGPEIARAKRVPFGPIIK